MSYPISTPQLYYAAVRRAVVADAIELDPSNTRPKYLYFETGVTSHRLNQRHKPAIPERSKQPPTSQPVLPRFTTNLLRVQKTLKAATKRWSTSNDRDRIAILSAKSRSGMSKPAHQTASISKAVPVPAS